MDKYCSYCNQWLPKNDTNFPKNSSGHYAKFCKKCEANEKLKINESEKECPKCGNHFKFKYKVGGPFTGREVQYDICSTCRKKIKTPKVGDIINSDHEMYIVTKLNECICIYSKQDKVGCICKIPAQSSISTHQKLKRTLANSNTKP